MDVASCRRGGKCAEGGSEAPCGQGAWGEGRAMNDLMQELVQGQLRSHQLPRDLHVWDLEEAFGALRRCSLEGTRRVEWGGCLALQEARLRIPHPVAGWAEGVNPACEPENTEHETYVGFAHIHLPDAHGQPYPGFSALDFRGSLVDGDHLALVCNGPEVFALVRTADCTEPRRAPADREWQGWERLYDDLIKQARRDMAADPAARRQGSAALHQALWLANREMCQRLGFALYHGLWGQPLARLFRPTVRRSQGVQS